MELVCYPYSAAAVVPVVCMLCLYVLVISMYILVLSPVPVLLAVLHIRQLTLPYVHYSSKQA